MTKLPALLKASFHNIVAKALYVAKRARPDIAVAISFLTTRVRNPDVQDWAKLRHLIEYLRNTTEMPLTLGATSEGVMHWYMDAAFAVHPNMRGHSGGALTLGIGFPMSSSSKQKLNTQSSTESELVGVDDLMSLILWSRNFLQAQGYLLRRISCIKTIKVQSYSNEMENYLVGSEPNILLLLRDGQDQVQRTKGKMVPDGRYGRGCSH